MLYSLQPCAMDLRGSSRQVYGPRIRDSRKHGQVETPMHGAQRALHVLLVNQHRDLSSLQPCAIDLRGAAGGVGASRTQAGKKRGAAS